jgi:phosphotransferase system  glucose/maltose/N-acetylglucosamine-specific IIC component
MFCYRCGAATQPGARFCNACGTELPTGSVIGSQPAVATAAGATFHPAASEFGPEPRGLAGWLVLVAIGLILGLLNRISSIVTTAAIFATGTAARLNDPASAGYIPRYRGLLTFEETAHVIFFTVNVILLAFFFSKRRFFPNTYIAFLLAYALYTSADYVLTARSLSHASDAVRQHMADSMLHSEFGAVGAVLAVLVWGLYMTKSRRVRNTFVR